MNINFILPCYKKNAPGGFKVMYDYANRLAEKGHEVTVIIPQKPNFQFVFLKTELSSLSYFIYAIKTLIKEIYYFLVALLRKKQKLNESIQAWLNSKVILRTPFKLSDVKLNDQIFYIVSWWENALWLEKQEVQNKFYLCQHYEDWGGLPALVAKSYESPNIKLISISSWVKDKILLRHNRTSKLLLNSIAPESFSKKIDFANRSYSVGLILRFDEVWKGSELALEFIRSLPLDQKVLVASYQELPLYAQDPRIVHRICRTNREMESFYNECQCFVFTSHFEGFGLPILEAMMCGNIVISTSVGCATDLINNSINAFLAEKIDLHSLLKCYEKVMKLTESEKSEISHQAILDAKIINPEAQTNLLESILES